jgi:guanylate cyclase
MLMCGFAGYMLQRYDRLNFVQAMQIERERQRSESLLLNVLPAEITETLKRRHSDEVAPALVRNSTIAERFEQASILFADIIGFTNLSIQMSPEEMVHLLNETFSYFDSLMDTFGVEKIRTIGDNYMVAAGVPRPRPDHAQALAGVALMMRDHAGAAPLPGAPNFRFRIGINSGPVVAGIIGRKKFQYDIWGDIVNTASRMESQGVPGEIQITRATYELIKDEFICVPRGRLEVKGVGELETWLLRGRMNSEGAAQPAVR